jgi:tetratricopeptide (TPR) repeat protein
VIYGPQPAPTLIDLVNENRLDEAQRTTNEAQAKGLDSTDLRFEIYLLAFLRHDLEGMARELTWATGRQGAEDIIAAGANTAAYFGKLRTARDLSRQAIDSATRTHNGELAAIYATVSALREALLGNTADARRQVAIALKHTPERYTEYRAALVLAYAGDVSRAGGMIDDMAKRFPQDTLVQSVYLPVLRAKLALSRKPSQAVEDLQPATAYEWGTGGLYSIYVRGEAYLAAHRGVDAAAEFQKILDHPGLVINNPIGALARLNLGRAYALEGGVGVGAGFAAPRAGNPRGVSPSADALAKARSAYQDFFTLWKDADPDVPILKQAQSEYAELR